MAVPTKQSFTEAIAEEELVLDGRFLIVDTIQDGYTSTYQGNHPYRVVKTGEDYAVYPVYTNSETGKLTNEKYPIIETDGDVIFFTVGSTVDPYNFTHFDSKEKVGTQTKEQQILHAFEAFITDEFRLANYNLFITSEAQLVTEDTDVEYPYEQTTKFERENINSNAGWYNPSEPNA